MDKSLGQDLDAIVRKIVRSKPIYSPNFLELIFLGLLDCLYSRQDDHSMSDHFFTAKEKIRFFGFDVFLPQTCLPKVGAQRTQRVKS